MGELEDKIFELNRDIKERLEDGLAVSLTLNGRPDFRAVSLSPFAHEPYGTLFNRGPRIVGTGALRCFAVSESISDDTVGNVSAIAEVGDELYGFKATPDIVNGIARAVGRPDLARFKPNPRY